MQGEVAGTLSTIAKAYLAATQKNGRAPNGPDELKPFLPPGSDQEACSVPPEMVNRS